MNQILQSSSRWVFSIFLYQQSGKPFYYGSQGRLGKPVHFDLKYYHSDYLRKEYRDKRISRLTPAPDGGAMADLGSHAISFLIAFLGHRLRITGALQAGHFDDVPDESDLFSQISLLDDNSHAAGTLSSSRISSGTGDNLSFEFYAEKGAIRYSSVSPDFFEYFTEESGLWITAADRKQLQTCHHLSVRACSGRLAQADDPCSLCISEGNSG